MHVVVVIICTAVCWNCLSVAVTKCSKWIWY